MKSSTNRARVAKKQSTSFAQMANNLLNVLQGCSKTIRLLLAMFLTLTVSASAWGADYSKNESWNFSTTGNSNWSGHNSGYCGACGNKSSAFNVYKTNITNFSNIDFSKYENVSLTIYVKAGTNSGTNSYTVKLIDANGNQVSTYTSTKTSGMGNGTNSSSAKESSVSFNPTTSFNGYKIEFPAKAYITQTRYVLTYDDKAASCDKKVTVNKGGPSNGSFSISKTGTYETCADPLVITLSNITPSAGYQFDAITQTGIGTGVTIDQANKTVTYAKNTSGTSTINVTFEQKQSATITLSEAGVETGVAGKYIGDSYTLPSTTSQSCGNLEFVGWSTVEINNSASKPASNYYAKGASVSLKAGENKFYAVFATKTTTTGGSTTTEQTKTETFENQTAGTVYNSTQTYTAANSNAGIAWKMYYGTVSTKAYLSGSKSAQMRWYNSASSNLPYVQTTTIVKGLKSISFKTLTSDNDYKYSVSYSTNNSTWTNVATSQSVGSTSNTQTKSYTINANGIDAYIKIAITSTSDVTDKATFRIDDVVFTYLETTTGGTTVTYSGYTTQCTTEPSQLATPTGLNVTNITSTSATLSWGAVTNASGYEVTVVDGDSYNKTISVEKNNTSITLDDLTQLTDYLWTVIAIGDGTNYTNSDESETGEFTTQKACTDAVNVNKGKPNNGSFTMVSGYQSTCNGPVTVTLNDIQPDAGYQFSTITQSGVDAAKVTIDNTAKTVTYAKNTTGNSTINVTFIEIPKYTVTLNPNYPNGKTGTFTYEEGELVDGNLVFTYDYNTASKTLADLYTSLTLDGYEFGGWYNAEGANPGEVSGSKCTTTGTITGNKTYYAKWSKLYSITLSENGTTTTPTTQTSTSYTLPTELSAGTCQDDTKELVGWSTVAIPNPGDKPTTKFYELGATVTLTADQTTFYAVFATVGEGGDDIPLISFQGGVQSDLLAIDGISALGLGSDYAEGNAPYRVKLDGTGDYILYTNTNGSKITKLYIKVKMIGGGNTSKITVQTSDNNSDYTNIYDWSIQGDQNAVKDVSLTVNSSSKYIRLYFTKGSNVGLGNLIFYTSSTTYSDYTTTCVKLPDPMLSFATEPANPIVFTDVACGGNSSKQSVTVVGENLRDVVEVSVTGSYKIARTASTAVKDFTTSLTLDKTAAGAIHSNYQTVYIISTPPAQSTEATTGTLTLTTTKGNTLIVNLSTPTVTCTQYTLTLNDRGTKTTAEYYAGASVPKPEDPTGVCTDPIHYVFDGWAETTVTAGATTYDKVTFPHTVEGNTKFYAVYRYVEDGGADSGDYVKLTEDLDDYSGDYLIVYEAGNVAFDGGRNNVDDELDATSNTIEVTINANTIESNAITDAAKFTIAKVDGGYSIKSASGYYIGWGGEKNGLNTNSSYTVNYRNTISDNTICGKTGYLKYNKTSGQERFRYYQSGQEAIALYRKAASYLYTTSPVCGPHLAITEGKDIYVTGGNAGGTRDLVIAQQKVSYKATRLNVGPTSQVPDVKVATNGITVGGVVTPDVKVTIDQTKEQQTDGTYTITGTITVLYQPSANGKQEDIQVQLAVDYNAEARDNFTVHARSLPSEFVIVAKSGDKWYALNGDMNNGSSANPANGQVTLDNDANPTEATYAPCNTIYTFDGLPNTGDRTYVRFQGTDGAWLWASSGTNVGIQNNVLKTTPEGNNKAYNWKLYTEDNITYQFGNANSNRQLMLSGEKFGMYASGVQDIRILPYIEKCLYNYAPTNLKVSVLKGTYVTLTWDAVAGATKYQYSTDATNWNDAGTDPTVTINGLTGDTEYTYYIRAYHEDDGVSQECIDYAEITFTTANCNDVPTDITYTADLSSITVSWTAAAPTATITYNTKEDGTGGGGTINNATSPYTISGGLNPNTTYYIQILADGTCASPIIPVKTEDVEVDIVEWYPQGIVVDINTDETVGVTLENEVSFGSGLGTEATELFFSKYYEASYNVKLVAIYNGTKNIIDLTDYIIKYGKTSWETNYITLKDFGATKGQIQPGEEIILYSMQDKTKDDEIMDCVHEDFPDGNWVRVTSSNNTGKGTLSFAGDKTLALFKGKNIIDIIGAVNGSDPNNSKANEKPDWGDANGWNCATGLSIADDTEIGISTNRCLLIRNNTVTSGENAVTNNIDNFNTLCSEWKGAQVPDDPIDNGVAASCENFAYVGTFDYSDYYTKYVSMGDEKEFDENARNADGTVTIPITDLYKQSCRNIRIKLSNSNGDVLTDREYKVPIMITTTQGTDGQTFLDLQQNLATVEVDGDGNVINTYPLLLDEVREICKTCDVVVRDNATLTKVTDGTENDHPQVRNVYVYEGASIVIPDGENHNYTINGLSLRRKGDVVASAQVQGTGKFVLPADKPVYLDLRVDANNWHWFTLPYDCLIEEVTWVDGTPAKYNTDWFLMYYDGESRAASTNPYDNHWKVYEDTKIEAGKGYIVGITGDLAHPDYTFELRFPMAQEVLADEQTPKTVPVNAWGVKSDNKPNNLGWNLVGNPYLNYYKTANGYSPLAGLPLIHYTYTDPVTGEWYYENSGSVPYVATPIDGGWYEYRQELASEVNMMPFTAYFVQVGDPKTHTNGQALNASFEASNRGKKSIVRRAPREVEEIEEPIIVRVELTNSKGESDKTSLVIDDRFTNEYEMNGDFFKWFGDYYNYYTKPVLYTIGADQGKRAFNALNEELAKQPIPMGMYAAQAGNYTFSLNQQFDLSRVEEVWLYDATQSTYTNLMQSDYTFSTSKVNGAGRFSLSVKLAPKVATSIDNVTADKVWATTHTKQVIVNGLENGMHLWLYDATGKLLYTEPTSNYQHTYLVPQTGTYFVSVMKGNAKQTIKVVVE